MTNENWMTGPSAGPDFDSQGITVMTTNQHLIQTDTMANVATASMTTNNHPITPPIEMVYQWSDITALHSDEVIFTLVAQWGADQELNACCEWLGPLGIKGGDTLRRTRRPNLLSLKEQALDALRDAESSGCLYVNGRSDIIRQALEALDD